MDSFLLFDLFAIFDEVVHQTTVFFSWKIVHMHKINLLMFSWSVCARYYEVIAYRRIEEFVNSIW